MAKVFGAVTTLNRDLMHSMARGPGPVVKQKWESDYQKALSRSATTGRPVLAACTGIPWCGPCLALEAEVFKSWKFNAWAAGQVFLLSLNDPDAEPPTPGPWNGYDINGVPTILGLDAQGAQLGRVEGYASGMGADLWIQAFETEMGWS